jgi:hypothetical protein
MRLLVITRKSARDGNANCHVGVFSEPQVSTMQMLAPSLFDKILRARPINGDHELQSHRPLRFSFSDDLYSTL